MHIHFSDCDIQVLEAIETNNHMPFCHSEIVAYAEFVSALADDGDTNQAVVSRNDLEAMWEEYARPQKTEGQLIGRCLLVVNGMISEGESTRIVFIRVLLSKMMILDDMVVQVYNYRQ